MKNTKMSTTIYLSGIGMVATVTYDKTSLDTCFNHTICFVEKVLSEIADNISIFILINIQTDCMHSPDPEIYISGLLNKVKDYIEMNASGDAYIKIVKNDNPPVYKRFFRSIVAKDVDEYSFNNATSILFAYDS